ncbi:MAG: alpha/beta hydrolase [Ruminococcus sp.]|nr:alpha/beta hydrolase [Ruminococcus sp.]MCM1381851.1 alpha/beta hydrolase [Muribaculaceae bacterium]MCM1478597.1 alpha/beta hydrolase [Muribaculaceae bacterium]
MKILTKAARIFLIAVLILGVLLLICFINHRIQLSREDKILRRIGTAVEVDGHSMNVCTEGEGDVTFVFMSGGGTCSPVLDFKSLYTLLSDEYRIAVVEKFGYGFSDVVDKERDINSILEDTRAALSAAGIAAPYILCPHSMSGLEALYWAQKYPDEVTAIIGLDMAVPQYYESMKISPFIGLAGAAAKIGVTRFIPNISESDAIKHGTLSEEEKALYRAVFYRRTATVTMLNETEAVRENAKTVESGGVPQIPMLLFISDGSGGTGFDKDAWRSIPEEYIAQVEGGEYVELDCPHYVHDYEYEKISENIKIFVENLIAE